MQHADGPDRFADAMGDDLGTVTAVLDNKLVELQVVWLQYRQLFGKDEATVHLLNRSAGLFFQVVQDQLWDGVLLGIARMTDPAKNGSNKNLTIHSLSPLIANMAFRSKVDALCASALEECGFAREHRNKRIAHRDHRHAVDHQAHPLSGISRAKVGRMLDSLGQVLNALHHHYRDTTVLYGDFIDHSGAELLVRRLAKLERLKRPDSAA
ncbi:hypothetical protein KR767_18795 [Luteibacter anthropi]|uniref:AbiU2 domain-containing protein n=1 Tax=Luteibacter anthropi TaxID=564369 RepID=UPI0020322510|nr:hypothetical protein [Luteibacter anthropi]URX62070.1 hypothetical protein KR767_18795 [Luteibacter anthropi]